jgi:hypothetical protein
MRIDLTAIHINYLPKNCLLGAMCFFRNRDKGLDERYLRAGHPLPSRTERLDVYALNYRVVKFFIGLLTQ